MSNNAFRDHIAHDNMTPLWEVLRGLTPREPKQTADPVIWRAETIQLRRIVKWPLSKTAFRLTGCLASSRLSVAVILRNRSFPSAIDLNPPCFRIALLSC